MMMMLRTGVECPAKIAMTALRACCATTGLCRISIGRDAFFFWLGVMHIFRSHAFTLHDVVIEAAMEQ
jgi:hypothetical protein